MTDNEFDVVLELPWPPSINHYWRHVELPLSKKKCPICKRPSVVRVATLVSQDGREWIKTVDRLLFAMNLPVMNGPLAMEVILYPPTKRAIDVDNRAKALLDSLKNRNDKKKKQLAYLFEDDSQIECLTLKKGPLCAPNGKCIVSIKQIPQAQGTLGF